MAKLIQNRTSLMVTVPQDLARAFGWTNKTEVLVTRDQYNKRLIVEELEEMPKGD